MKVLNQMGPGVTRAIEEALPGTEVVAVPLEGAVEPGLCGDALISFRRASNLVDVARAVPWVHIAGAGVEGIDPALFEDGRVVTCSRGAHAIPMAEFVMGAIIAYERRIPAIWVDDKPAGPWLPLDLLEARIAAGELTPPEDPLLAVPANWGFMWMGEMTGKTVGIVGLGGIGVAVAKRALSFDMNVVAVRRSDAPSPLDGVEITTSLHDLLARSDHVVLCAPVTESTMNLLDEVALAAIKPGAHVINVGRGELIDEDALVRALDDGRVSLASLDVALGEPLESGHRFYSHPRVRLSPHISWTSPRRHARSVAVFTDNLVRSARGEPLEGVVEHGRGY